MRGVLDPYRRGGTVAGAFGEAIRELLAPFDVNFVDAADPVLKEASLRVLRGALSNAEEHEVLLRKRSSEIVAAGYRPQVKVVEGATNVFQDSERGRERIHRRGDGFGVRGRRDPAAAEELLEELERDPHRFSPNVFLRPIVESEVFPTLAYVGGPGEVAYFAQVGALFPAFGMAPPVAVPRFSAQVVERATERALRALELSEDELTEPRERLLERVARRELPEGVGEALRRVREGSVASYQRLIEEVNVVDPTLIAAMGGSRNRALAEAERAERRILRSIKRSERQSLLRLERVLDTLRPGGVPQDRALNVLSFVGRFGSHFLEETMRSVEKAWRLPERGAER